MIVGADDGGECQLMCLVLLGWRVHPRYRLIVAANRDEYHVRRSAPMRAWPEVPGLLAGRDLDAGPGLPGVWLGFRAGQGEGRFAAVTNVNRFGRGATRGSSRGHLTRDYLCGADSASQFVRRAAGDASGSYDGYNLVLSDLHQLWWFSNSGPQSRRCLAPGWYAVANDAAVHTIDETDAVPATAMAHKARRGLHALAAVVRSEVDTVRAYLDMLTDRTPVAMSEVVAEPGIPVALQRMLSARFLSNRLYGTRCSTVLLIGEDGSYRMCERRFGRHRDSVTGSEHRGRVELAEVGR